MTLTEFLQILGDNFPYGSWSTTEDGEVVIHTALSLSDDNKTLVDFD